MTLPTQMKAWRLYGAGMEHFGDKDAPATITIPSIKDTEVLMKVDAIGLCFSDVKLIRAGESHPRVYVDSLAEEPVIPGHEAVLTVVQVGDKMKEKFSLGQRFIIQADIFVDGVGYAYGYAIDGGMAQYSVMTDKVLDGDDGCYLLPISDKLSAAEAALIEPWTCVIAAYRIDVRTSLKKNGVLRIIGDGTDISASLGSLISGDSLPARVICENVGGDLLNEVNDFCSSHGITIAAEAQPEEKADDLIIVGNHSVDTLEKLSTELTQHGICCFVGSYDDTSIELDVGGIHYSFWRYIGTDGNDISAAYTRTSRHTLKPGGVTWMPGGAGAMGQMHVQLALENPQPPRKVIVTDLDSQRLTKLRERLGSLAEKAGVEFITHNPSEFDSPDAFAEQLLAETDGTGCDDIVMLVPVPAVVSDAVQRLGVDSLMNIFAGIPAGKKATFSLDGITQKGQRFIASSGSGMDDIKHTLELTESGKLSPVYALAAVGGMNSLKEGIQGVMDARFPGKTVIYPQAENMPLVAVEDVDELCAGAANTLNKDGVLTFETEKLLRDTWE